MTAPERRWNAQSCTVVLRPCSIRPMQWDDLRYVLAVARMGSAMRAARELGVDQTTVLRKLDLLEKTLGTSLFERRKTGLTPTPAGKLVAEAADEQNVVLERL